MPKIVVVLDDDEEMEFIYALLLEAPIKKGLVELKFFSDSRKLLPWLAQNEVDLMLSDINMPYFDGLHVMDFLKRTGRGIPAYFVSGHEETDYKEIMKELGVYRFLSKPLNFNSVLGLIELDLGILAANL